MMIRITPETPRSDRFRGERYMFLYRVVELDWMCFDVAESRGDSEAVDFLVNLHGCLHI